MNSLEIQSIIKKKKKRQFVLEERKKNIEEIEENLNASYLQKSFQGFYYYFKRFFLMLFSVALLLMALIAFVKPDIIIADKYKNGVVDSFTEKNLKEEQETLNKVTSHISEEIFYNKLQYENPAQIDKIINNSIVKTMVEKANEDYKSIIFFIGILLLFISLIMLYIARITKKLKERNDLILESDELAQKIIEDYTLTLNEEKEELRMLKKAYLSTSHI